MLIYNSVEYIRQGVLVYESLMAALIHEWSERIPPPDLVPRETGASLDSLFRPPKRIVTIVGLRRVGKTYFMYQLVSELRSRGRRVFYVNFEDERVPENKRVLSDLLTLLKRECPSLTDVYMMLDEVHRIPEWSRWLRRIFDLERPNIVVTGSSSKLASSELPTELRGRALTLRVFPLRFSEFLRFKRTTVDLTIAEHSEDERSKLVKYFEEYLLYGGLPEVVLAPGYRKLQILQDYFGTIVLRDIAERREVRDISRLQAVLKLLVNSTYFTASRMANLLRTAGFSVSKDTILSYVDYAREAYFVELLPRMTESERVRLISPKKVYLGDNGFITALARKRIHYGRLLENLVFIELSRRYFGDASVEICYWSDGESEVDFVVRRDSEVEELIQVCWDPTDPETRERELRGLRRLMRYIGVKRATVVTGYYEEVMKEGSKVIEFVPYWKWELRREKSPQAV